MQVLEKKSLSWPLDAHDSLDAWHDIPLQAKVALPLW